MRVILTHEQADFDAVASQLGGWLLDDAALPILSGRINRNVRAFLTIYGAELPFVERRDLPAGSIEAIMLVDTQSSISLKGMHADTLVQVVDHHARRDVPADWRITIEPTGATATIFVESIRERGVALSSVQATLLMLGIYEDTGSLTYTRTTPRDIAAAAWLLQSGANLHILGEYLHHSLSLNQQALYEDLQKAAEVRLVHGHTVILACGDATEMSEELSTIAHKMRDTLEPDALFLLLQIRGGVQVIARSTSDHIDVARIAARFGGGGHYRASAAMVKDADAETVCKELAAELPDFVRPAITVDQIMSRGPRLLPPGTPVKEAADLMRQDGYEGYPVVENGQVIGLLTRRAVDRAVGHKLNITAEAVMEAGDTTVHPQDSIEKLQQVMTDTGWGQIPVTDPQTGEIIGIVTRTDLIKTLTPQPAVPGKINLASKLEATLPVQDMFLLKNIAETAHAHSNALFIVGGFVRDLLLDRPSTDYDLVVEGDAIGLGYALVNEHGGRITVHKRFGTAKWHLPPGSPHDAIDLVTARTEFYTHPTALPTVRRGSIKLDLHRRDFTLNTLALRLDGPHYGELHDYWGGLSDLNNGLIRVLHSLSFVDDPTRMLRAVRFEQRFGFTIERRTLELLSAALNLLDRTSGDRIRHELNYVLAEPNRDAMLTRLDELGLLHAIHNELAWDAASQARLDKCSLPEPFWGIRAQPKEQTTRFLAYTLWLLPVNPDTVRKITRRLKLDTTLERIILEACALWRELPSLKEAAPSAITLRLDQAKPLSVYTAWLASEDPAVREHLQTYAKTWRHIKARLDGNDLHATGLPPGPAYATILQALRAAWLDGEIGNEQEENRLLQKLVQQFGGKQ